MEEMYDYLGRLQIKRLYFTVASFCAAIFYAQNPRDTKPCLWDFLSFIPISEKGHRLFQVHFREGPYTRFQAVMGKSHGKGAIMKNGSGTMLSPRIEI